MWHCRPAMSTFLAVVLALAMVSDVAAKATLRNNGYEDLTISLDEPDSIKPKECGQLVENIKALIRSFSASLFRATDQLAFVRSARIILPSWWEAGQCGLGRSQVQPVRADEKADITVVGQNFFEEPKFPEVIQHRGCGLPGKDFFLPLSFIWDLNQTDAILGNPGRLLVREWAKYRYGVFEELGVQENPMYPTFYSPEDGFDSDLGEEEIPTSCNNKIPAGNKMCNTGSCFFRPDPMDTETNSKIDSSLMSFPNLPNVEKFCNQETHNRDAPTRQNVLCSGRSIWEVMTRHPDFQGKKRMPEGAFMEPEFRFVSRENRKIVFLLDSTSGHNGVAGLWPIIARATYRLLEELQESRDYDRVELGLVEFAGSIEKSERLTSVRLLDINSKSFISRYPARNSSEPCLSCAFHKAEDLVGRDLMTYSEIVVVTQGFAAGQSKFSNPRSSPSSTHLDDADVVDSESEHDIGSSPYGGVAPRTSGLGDEHDPIFDQLPNAGAKIHAIQLSGEPHPMLKDLTARSGGRFSAVEDASEEAATFMELLSFYESVFQIANPSKLMQTVFRPTRPYDVLSGNFYVDSSINQGLLFVAHYPANEAPSAVKVRSPTGQLYDRVLLPKVPYVADVIRVETHIETGQWTFEVESISTRALGLEIVGYGPKTETSPVRVEFWSSWDDGDDRNPQNAPLMFFVSVRRGREPLTKVQVRAVVERISDDLTDNVTVVLTDDGRGDPDITSGDGIYSGYFTEFLRSSGQYRVRISAVRDGFNGEAFQREIPGGIFKLSHAPSDDVYPPNLITDLRVVTHPGNQTFELTWTAPGGDYNKGKATRYELRYANDWNSLRGDNFPSAENLKTRPPNPQGAQERIAFNTGEHGLSPGKVFYFAIRAHDGWWGPISRPVKAYLKPAPTLKPPSASQEGISGFDDDGLSGGGILSSGAGFLNLEVIAIIAGCVVLGVLVISSTLCYFVVFSKKKGKDKRDKSDSYQTSSAVAVTVGDGKAEPDLIVRSPTHHPHHQQTTLKMDKSGEIDSVTELETLPESYSYYPRGVGVGGPAMSGDMLDGNGMLAGSTPSPRSSHFMGNGNLGSTSHFISASELLAEHERRKSYSVNGGYSSGSPASTATVGAGGSIPDNGHPVEAVYANFDPRTKTYGTSNNKMSAQGVPPPEYSVSVGYDSYNLQNGGTAISGYYPGAESDASSSADPLQQRGGYVPMYHPQQQPAQQTWIGYDPHQYGTLQSPSSQLAPSERGGSLNGTLSKGPPPVVPPKPRGPPILDESHSSSGSDRKIWTATQV